MTALAIGAVLGFFAGIMPGPFFTLVATTSVRDSLGAGLRVALVPLGTELPAMIAALFLLTQLPEEGLRWMGVAGGVLLLYVAWRVASTGREEEGDPEEDGDSDGSGDDEPKSGHFRHAVALGLVSPTPWVFWIIVGAPITMNRWHEGPLQAVIFVATFLGLFIGTLAGVAWAAHSTGKQLGKTGSRRFFYGAAAVLAIGGVILAWQSWIGNFTEMVQAPERIEEEITG